MQKTKVGISVGLLGAGLYFMGFISVVAMVIMAGYVLIFEENEWLKKTAVKSVGVVIFFTILSTVVGLVGNSSTIITNLVHLVKGSISLNWFNGVITICRNLISIIETLFLLILGFKALKQGNVKLSSVDNIIKEHM
ncbi:MAG: hypothetical protein WDA24_07315 [Tissierellales bacterium]